MGDWDRLRMALRNEGVAGANDVGRFVSDTRHFTPSGFDERAAMPTLLRLLPTLTEPRAVAAVARHLCRPWARPDAFEVLLATFRQWAEDDGDPGWALGDALANAATDRHASELIEVACDGSYGTARQMIVGSLWRFRAVAPVASVLTDLISDSSVAFHAMSALRRTIGNEGALPYLHELRDTHPDDLVRGQATKQIKKAEEALAKKRSQH